MLDCCSVESVNVSHVGLLLCLVLFVCCHIPIHFPKQLHALVASFWLLLSNYIDLSNITRRSLVFVVIIVMGEKTSNGGVDCAMTTYLHVQSPFHAPSRPSFYT
jgi:hypothetical protein